MRIESDAIPISKNTSRYDGIGYLMHRSFRSVSSVTSNGIPGTRVYTWKVLKVYLSKKSLRYPNFRSICPVMCVHVCVLFIYPLVVCGLFLSKKNIVTSFQLWVSPSDRLYLLVVDGRLCRLLDRFLRLVTFYCSNLSFPPSPPPPLPRFLFCVLFPLFFVSFAPPFSSVLFVFVNLVPCPQFCSFSYPRAAHSGTIGRLNQNAPAWCAYSLMGTFFCAVWCPFGNFCCRSFFVLFPFVPFCAVHRGAIGRLHQPQHDVQPDGNVRRASAIHPPAGNGNEPGKARLAKVGMETREWGWGFLVLPRLTL